MTATLERQARLVFDMDDATYHGQASDSLSSTFVKLLTNYVPAKAEARFRNRKPSKAMDIGKAAHSHALGTGPDLIVWQHDGRTKEGKAERAELADLLATEAAVAVSADERNQIFAMAEALRAHPEIAAILEDSDHEVSGFWMERDVSCRARFDILTPTVAYDYKSAEDVSADGFEHAMSTWGYHQQAEFYQRCLRAANHPAGDAPMRFICQEKQEPYLVQIHTCDDLAIEVAAALNDRAIDIYAKAKASGVWDGYPELEAAPTGLPAHYYYRHADVIPDHLNPYSDPLVSM